MELLNSINKNFCPSIQSIIAQFNEFVNIMDDKSTSKLNTLIMLSKRIAMFLELYISYGNVACKPEILSRLKPITQSAKVSMIWGSECDSVSIYLMIGVSMALMSAIATYARQHGIRCESISLFHGGHGCSTLLTPNLKWYTSMVRMIYTVFENLNADCEMTYLDVKSVIYSEKEGKLVPATFKGKFPVWNVVAYLFGAIVGRIAGLIP